MNTAIEVHELPKFTPITGGRDDTPVGSGEAIDFFSVPLQAVPARESPAAPLWRKTGLVKGVPHSEHPSHGGLADLQLFE